MSLPSFSIKQTVFVNLFMFLVIAVGIAVFITIPKEEWPDVPLRTVSVTTIYQGASAQEMEKLITKEIEEEVDDIDDIDYLTSFSSEGRSVVNVNFTMEIDDIERKIQKVQNEVNKVTDLPENAETPEVEQVKLPFQLIRIALIDGAHERQIGDIADDMAYELKQIYGVQKVEITGKREREVWVEVDPYRLEGYGLSLNDVILALRRKNLNMPAGTLQQAGSEFIVRTVGEVDAVESMRDIIVSKSPDGGHVYVGDVARVSDTFEEETVIAKVNGRRCIQLTVSQEDYGNITDIVKEIKQVALSYRDRLPPGADIVFFQDNSRYLQKRLSILYSSGVTGFFLVLVSLFLFIGGRPAVLAIIGMPAAFCATVILMDITGITVNSLSLFSVIIVIGMIVDDAIIVTENVYRYIEQGMPVRKAAALGAEEVMWPVVAAIATTVAAFSPMLLMTGPLGQFMSTVPKVVCFALLASLWEAFFILPSHLADFARPSHANVSRGSSSVWFQKLQNIYTAVLSGALRRRYLVLAVLVCVSAVIFLLSFATLDFILFPKQDFETVVIRMEAPQNTPLAVTEKVAARAEEAILSLPEGEILSVSTTVGQKLANLGFKEGGNDLGSNVCQFELRLSASYERTRSGDAIVDDIRERLDALPWGDYFTFEKRSIGPPVGRPVAVRIMGDEFDTLQHIGSRVMGQLAQIRGVVDIAQDFRPGKDEIRVTVDEDRASLYGLSVEAVALSVQHAYMGGAASEYTDRNEEIDIIVKLDERIKNNLDYIGNMKIKTPDGALIPVKNVALVERAPGFGKIRRYDQNRVINVTANIAPGANNSRDVIFELERRMEPILKQFPGYQLSYGGEFEETERSMTSLFEAFGLALFLIYMILATMFQSFIQPFLIMLSIPFAALGVFVGLVVMQTPMGMMSFLGVIALAGIVVNDSIVLIDFINRRRAEVHTPDEIMPAIIESCKTRLRPILLTEITTIFGLLPLALGIFGREVLMTPMAIAIVWGLLFSSVLTLLIIPCFYLVFEDIKAKTGR